jgi:hypothetical protein
LWFCAGAVEVGPPTGPAPSKKGPENLVYPGTLWRKKGVLGQGAAAGLWYDAGMPLVRLEVPDTLPPVPPEAARFIADARGRVDAFIESRLADPVPAFVPSDYTLVYGALRYVADAHLAAGRHFCEWGSGAGVIACLAAMVGFEACGIEFESDLVDVANRLAQDHGLSVEFASGNLVPHGGQKIAEEVDEFEWLAVGGADAYEKLGLEIDDFDVIFAFPWPGEERVLERIFDRFAADGAILVTFNDTEGIRLFRRRSERSRR